MRHDAVKTAWFGVIKREVNMTAQLNNKQLFINNLSEKLGRLHTQGLYKQERVLASRQGAEVLCDDGRSLINLCASNYLGLSGDEATVQAAIKATEQYGYGLSSVRFICGTQTIHKQLEHALSDFLGMEDTILYAGLLTPMAVCSSRCSTSRMPSSRTR